MNDALRPALGVTFRPQWPSQLLPAFARTMLFDLVPAAVVEPPVEPDEADERLARRQAAADALAALEPDR
jgi:hypothetical protein